METRVVPLIELKPGMRVSRLVDTLWGVHKAWETVAYVKVDEEQDLVEVRLNNGPSLAHLLRSYPNTTVEVMQ